MFEIRLEPTFENDYKAFKRHYPHLVKELVTAIEELIATGRVPDSYKPHILDNNGGNYNGHIDFHLSDGKVDVLVLYLPHKTNPVIRLVRIGSHDELFQGKML